MEGPGYDQWCQRAVAKWEGIKQAIYAEQEIHTHANMWGAVNYLLDRDEQHPHMIGDLRLALNAIGHKLGIIHLSTVAGIRAA